MTVCAFLRAKTGNMVSILQITFRKIDAADFADTPLFGKIQKEEKLNSTKKRKSDLLAEIACYLFIHVFLWNRYNCNMQMLRHFCVPNLFPFEIHVDSF